MKFPLAAVGLALGLGSVLVGAQSNTTSISSTAASTSYTLSYINITSTAILPVTTTSNRRTYTLTSARTVRTTFTSTESIPITPSSTSTSSAASATATGPPPNVLATKVDGAFACLGVLLVLTGLPTAFLGHKNRWSSFFLLGFYSFTLATGVVILRFGVLSRLENQLSLPDTKLRGLYLLASGVAGVVGGGVAIFFWQTTKYLIGALGGLVLGLWIQCMQHSGLVRPIGYRWLMYIGSACIGFTLCTVPKLHYPVLLAATAMVGATAFMLGVDCFTTAGLKEFYVWNLGFNKLFPRFATSGFPVSQTMAIELGLIAAVALAGAAVQLRVLSVLRVRLQELNEEHRRKDAELEQEAAERYKDVEAAREEWEKKHGNGSESASMSAPTVLNRVDSGLDTPTEEAPGTPRTVTVAGGRPVSSLFNFPYSSVNSGSDPSRPPQTAGALPALDLGTPVKDEIPRDMIDAPTILEDHHEIRERSRLADEIQEIRKSLGMMSSPPPEPRATRNSTGTSLSALGGAGLERAVATEAAMRAAEAELGRPIGGGAGAKGGLASARDRVRSMITVPTARRSSFLGDSPVEPSSSSGGASAPVGARSPNVGNTGRPSSVPLADDDWQTYVQERKLFQPPSGVTAPIPTTPLPTRTVRSPPGEGVMAALANRQRRESMFDPTLPTVESAIDEAEEHPESSRAIDHRSSWISFKDQLVNAMFSSNSQRSPSPGPGPILPTAHSHTRTRSQPSLFHRRSNSTSTQLQQPQPQAPITVLPPARSPKSSQAAPPQQPSPPAERVLTYEEYNERHKARLHALQQPLTKQEKKEATLADARARWERSKAVEGRVMAKKHAEEAAAIEARGKDGGHRRRSSTLGLLDRRQSTGLPDSPNARSSFETEQSSQMPARPAAAASKAGPSKRSRPSEHRRNSLSLEALGGRSASRMSSNFKVEEWQKYQAATTAPPATSAGSSASDDVPLARASPSRKSHTPEPRLTPDRT